jgi:mono/diheme cytochrome c family protein
MTKSQAIARFLLVTACLSAAAVIFGSQRPVAAAEAPKVRAVAALPPTNKYTEICQACHQPTGLGVEPVFPPLAGSEWLTGRPVVPIAIALKGLQGDIVVKGKKYSGVMTAWEAVLSDDDLAATLSYARSQWGNRGTPITGAQVRAVRARFAARTTPWTAAELKALK